MKIEEVLVDDIIPYENNPRINDFAVDKVAASIKEFGFKVPLIIDNNHIIIAGHTRLKAAIELGLNKVPVIKADDLTEEQVKAFRLADNKTAELAEWNFEKLEKELNDLDFDMSAFGFEFEEIEELSLDEIEGNADQEEKFIVRLSFDSFDDWTKIEDDLRKLIDGVGEMVVGTK